MIDTWAQSKIAVNADVIKMLVTNVDTLDFKPSS